MSRQIEIDFLQDEYLEEKDIKAVTDLFASEDTNISSTMNLKQEQGLATIKTTAKDTSQNKDDLFSSE